MARKADVARKTRRDVTQHTRPHGRAMQAHAAPRWCKGGADTWKGPHESTRTPDGGTTWREGASISRAHGLVGLGYRIGAEMQ